MDDKKVLRKINLKSFGEMTGKKVEEFLEYIPSMDPETVKKAIEQFPSFSETLNIAIGKYIDTVSDVLHVEKDNGKQLFDACNAIIESLKKIAEKETITTDERTLAINNMIEIAHLLDNHNREERIHHIEILKTVASMALAIALLGASALGVRIYRNR